MRIDFPRKEDTPKLWALWKEAFGDGDEFLATFERTAFCSRRCRAVFDGEDVAAALYFFDCALQGKKLAYLYAVATAKAYRGQGLCHQLMADTHRHLKNEGYAGVILVPGEAELFSFYERMGYRIFGGIGEFSATADGSGVFIKPVSIEVYAEARRDFLPVGGILQEGENLRFLSAQADLYVGEDFVLAARREGDRLFGIELLGRRGSAPAILTALGCRDGIFRTPGEDRPFAMYYPLAEDRITPTHFGLAFD